MRRGPDPQPPPLQRVRVERHRAALTADQALEAFRALGLRYSEVVPHDPEARRQPRRLWTAACPLCPPDGHSLKIGEPERGRPVTFSCRNRCDRDEIEAALRAALPSRNGAGPEQESWLAGVPMDPAATVAEPLPALPGFPFLHAGASAVIVGPTGGGRSSLIEACLYDAATAGLRCAYLGCEVIVHEFNARAAMLAECRGDAVDDQLRERLARVRYLSLPSTIARAGEDPDAWIEGVSASYEVVAIDPLSAVASTLNLDFDQRNAEFVRVYDRLIAPLTAASVTVVMVDNTGHAIEAKSRAKGVSAKQDRADLTFACALSTSPVGLIVKAHKVRSIRAPFQRGDEWIFLRDSQKIERRHGGSDAAAGTFRPTRLMQRVSEAVEVDPGLTRNAIRTAIRGRAEYVDLALELLLSEGYIEVRGDGQAHRHHSLKRYREDAETPTESTESQPGPNRVPDPVAAPGPTESHTGTYVPVDSGPGSGAGGPATESHRSQPMLDESEATR